MSAAWEWDCRNQHGCRAMWQRNLVAMTQRQRQIQKQRQRYIQRQTLTQLSRNKIVETTMAVTLCGNRIHSLWRNGDSDRNQKILWYSDDMDKEKEIIPCLGSEAQSFWERNNLRGSKLLSFWLWRLRDCLRLKWFRKVCFFICVEFEAPFQSWEGCQLRRRRRSWKSFRWSKNGRIYIANESKHVRCKCSDLIVFKVVAKKLERMLETTLGQVSCQGMNFSCFWL